MHKTTNRSARMPGIAKWIAVLALSCASPVKAQSNDPNHVTIPPSGVPLVPPRPAPLAAPATLPNVAPQGADLSGVWTTQTGATFYVRQIGSQIWWYGTQSPANPRWTNVASGQFDGTVVRVHWVDVPRGMTANSGDLALTAVDSRHLIVSENPNNFLSAEWFR